MRKTKTRKKEVTVNELAVMVQKGFVGIDERFEIIDERFERIDERFDRIDEHSEKMEENLILISRRFDEFEVELIEIRKKLDNIVYRHEYEILKDRVAALEKKLTKARK